MCCDKVVCVDMVVCIRRKKIRVPDSYSGKEIMREELVTTVNWAMECFDCCHVGFLPRPYVPDAIIYDGVLCQVMEVFEKNHPSHWAWWIIHSFMFDSYAPWWAVFLDVAKFSIGHPT